MSTITPCAEAAADSVDLVPVEAGAATPAKRHDRSQRGMVTIEYAIGAILVIVIVGMVITAVQASNQQFNDLVKAITGFITQFAGDHMGKK